MKGLWSLVLEYSLNDGWVASRKTYSTLTITLVKVESDLTIRTYKQAHICT